MRLVCLVVLAALVAIAVGSQVHGNRHYGAVEKARLLRLMRAKGMAFAQTNEKLFDMKDCDFCMLYMKSKLTDCGDKPVCFPDSFADCKTYCEGKRCGAEWGPMISTIKSKGHFEGYEVYGSCKNTFATLSQWGTILKVYKAFKDQGEPLFRAICEKIVVRTNRDGDNWVKAPLCASTKESAFLNGYTKKIIVERVGVSSSSSSAAVSSALSSASSASSASSSAGSSSSSASSSASSSGVVSFPVSSGPDSSASSSSSPVSSALDVSDSSGSSGSSSEVIPPPEELAKVDFNPPVFGNFREMQFPTDKFTFVGDGDCNKANNYKTTVDFLLSKKAYGFGGSTPTADQPYFAELACQAEDLIKALPIYKKPLTEAVTYFQGADAGAGDLQGAIDKVMQLGLIIVVKSVKGATSLLIENIPKANLENLKLVAYPSGIKGVLASMFGSKGNIAISYLCGAKFDDPKNTKESVEKYIQDFNPDLTDVLGLNCCPDSEPNCCADKNSQGCADKCKAAVLAQLGDGKLFRTHNQFFYRKLKPAARDYLCYDDADCDKKASSMGSKFEKNAFISPADSRLHVFPTVGEATAFWVKGSKFSLRNMVAFSDPSHYDYYEGGSMVIARLAPQDYHRFHFPVEGKICENVHYPGEYYSVNPMLIRTKDVFTTNKRMHTTINSPQFGCVTFVSVGATCVGSVIFTSSEGATVSKGQEHGYMAFGGSTVIMVVPKGAVTYLPELVNTSKKGLETIVNMGNKLGVAGAVTAAYAKSPCAARPDTCPA